MLVKRIIPCLDVRDGRVVKGVQFVDIRDAGDPVEVAQLYDREGADELVFLDITASYEQRKIILDVVARTAEQVFMPLTVGGGVSSIEDMRNLLNAGADKVSVNTAAVKEPALVERAALRFGSQCIVVAIDARQVQAPQMVQMAWITLGGIYPRWTYPHWPRCGAMGRGGGTSGGRRDSPHQHGSRWHARGL